MASGRDTTRPVYFPKETAKGSSGSGGSSLADRNRALSRHIVQQDDRLRFLTEANQALTVDLFQAKENLEVWQQELFDLLNLLGEYGLAPPPSMAGGREWVQAWLRSQLSELQRLRAGQAVRVIE
jgi:hypothetical protein